MIKNSILICAISLTFQQAYTQQITKDRPQQATIPMNNLIETNPFFKKSTLQYQAPDFSLIKNHHFKPAFDFGLKEQLSEIEAITSNPSQPSFENTILPLEKSGEILHRAQIIFYNLSSANTNDTIQKIEEEYAPIFAAHADKISLNTKLYKRISMIDIEKLDNESKKLVDYYKTNFENAGANLSDSDKEVLKKINQEIASLSTYFDKQLLDARKEGALLVETKEELNGLSDEEIKAAEQLAIASGHKGKYLLSLLNTTQQPLLQSLHNRKTRENLYKASWNRAEKGDANDTRTTLEKLALLRLQKAQLLGKQNFAEWKLQDQMAKTPDHAFSLLKNIGSYAVKAAKIEVQSIQQKINKEDKKFKLEPWDWNYYAEQVRKEKYDIDDNQLKPYFEVSNVLEKGVFYAAEKFYGISFKKRPDLPVYHPDVVAYEIFDNNGESLAIYYLDFYTRDSKRGGAWMNNFVEQSTILGQKPVIINVFNYQKPIDGKPSLISFDDVNTMFHEFGHTLHGLFANQKYASLSGTNVARDFVEFPSQINEHFALLPEVLQNYALHYETAEPMPDELIKKLKKSSIFNQGYNTLEIIKAATIDMAWHSVTNTTEFKPTLEFEKEALTKYGLLVNEVPPRYHSPYFAHIWGGGYASGYYAYVWSETLDNDAWEWISTHGGMTRENGDLFRKKILSVGNTIDLNEAFKDFTGHNPDIKPLLKNRGFIK